MGISLGTKVSFEEKKPKISDQLLKLTSRILYLGGRHVQVKNNGKVETISENERFSTIAKVAKVSLLVLASLITVGVVCLNRYLARKYQRQDVSAPSSAPSSKREDSVRKDPDDDFAPFDFDKEFPGSPWTLGPDIGYVVGPPPPLPELFQKGRTAFGPMLAGDGFKSPAYLGSKILAPEEGVHFKERPVDVGSIFGTASQQWLDYEKRRLDAIVKESERKNAQLFAEARVHIAQQQKEYDRTIEAYQKGAMEEFLLSCFHDEFERFKKQVETGKKACSEFPIELSGQEDPEVKETFSFAYMPEITFSLEMFEAKYPKVKEFSEQVAPLIKEANEVRMAYLFSKEEDREEKGQAFLKTLETLGGKIPDLEAFLQSLKVKKEG